MAESTRKYVLFPILILLIFTSCSGEGEFSAREVKSIRYVNLIVQGKYPEAEKEYGSTMKAKMSTGALRSLWEETIVGLGEFRRILGAREEKTGQFDIVIVKCEFKVTTLDIKIIYDRNMKVMDLSFMPGETKVGWQKLVEYFSD